jgi:MarR family transcriptional regulator, organic hydroperoxide resistance regulator
MKDKTIDYVLRTTWLTVFKMYNEEALKFDSTMATGLTLLSIDQEKGTPSTSLGPKRINISYRFWKRKKSLFKRKSSHI